MNVVVNRAIGHDITIPEVVNDISTVVHDALPEKATQWHVLRQLNSPSRTVDPGTASFCGRIDAAGYNSSAPSP